MKKVAIVGVGRVGLPLTLYLESLGLEVIGIDRDTNMLKLLRSKIMPFEDKGFQELLTESNVLFTDEIKYINEVDFIIITVGTPLLPHIETDLSNVENVIDAVIPYLREGQCIILRSTLAPNTTNYVKNIIELKTDFRIGENFGLTYCPERLSEHNAMEELKILPQIIGSEDDLSYQSSLSIFKNFGVKILKTNYVSAELAKLYNNSARYIEFSIANQFAIIADNLGQNIYEILRLTNEDYPRSFPYRPGLTAGTCLRKDFGMINELSSGTDLFLAAWKVNEYMPYHLTELASNLTTLSNKNISILGYTFKNNSDDIRDSLVPKLIRYIEKHVPKSVVICEPNIQAKKIGKYKNIDLEASIDSAEVLFVANNHIEFSDHKKILDKIKPGTVVVDIWNCFKTNNTAFIKEDR